MCSLSLKQDEKDALLRSIQDKVSDSSHVLAGNNNEAVENHGMYFFILYLYI